MTKTSNQLTACPECDSGNLYVQGSTVECLSCGWQHTAAAPKRTRTTKVPSKAPASPVAAQTAPAPTHSIAAQLQAAVTPVKPKAERKARMPEARYVLTAKGNQFTPDPKRSRVKGSKNQETWLMVKSLFTTESVVSHAAIVAAIPTHKDFVGYAVRSGWLAVGQ